MVDIVLWCICLHLVKLTVSFDPLTLDPVGYSQRDLPERILKKQSVFTHIGMSLHSK